MTKGKELTGYPAIDKLWLNAYKEKVKTDPLPKCTMYQYVYENNKDNLSGIAFNYFGKNISYKEFFENVKKVAGSFTAMGVGQGDIVTVMSMQTPETIYTIYGLNYIGAVVNLIYITSSSNDILDKIETTDSKALVVLDVALDKLEEIRDAIKVPVIILGISESMPIVKKSLVDMKAKKEHSYATYAEFLKQAVEPNLSTVFEAPAIIVYTSGTTGKPKGVVLSNNALNAHSFQELYAEFHFERGKKFLFILPPFVGFGISHIHLALNSGTTSYLWIQMEPPKIVEEFLKLKPDFFVGGPAFADEFLKHKPKKIPRLTLFVGGGGALAESIEDQLNDFLEACKAGTKYANGYGLTETGSTLCCNTNQLYRRGSVGLPMPRTNVKVVDIESGKELKYDEVGELWFSTPSMMDTYFKDTKSTDEMIIVDENGERWIKTGDLGAVDADGYVYIKGRIKRIYITRSSDGIALKLFPQKTEELVIETIEEVEKCGVIVLDDETRMAVSTVIVTLKDKKANSAEVIESIWKVCREKLAEHEMPVAIKVIDQMPITPSGKIDYKKLEETIAMGDER